LIAYKGNYAILLSRNLIFDKSKSFAKIVATIV